MASKISTCFLSHGLCGLSQRHSNARFFASPSHRLLPVSCGMRERNLSSQSKRQSIKKASPGRPPSVIVNGETESANASIQNLAIGNEAATSGSDLDGSDNSNEKFDQEVIIDVENENAKVSDDLASPEQNNLAIIDGPGQQLSTLQLDDLMGMVKNAEKNILLLNRARIRAVDDLENIFSEKELLQRQISSLEMKLAETDARMRVAAQEKIHVDLLEDQLENLRNELLQRGGVEGCQPDTYADQVHQLSADPLSNQSSMDSLSVELKYLRAENNSLKNDIQTLRSEVGDVKRTDERVMILERQQSGSDFNALSEELRSLRAENESLKNDLETLRSELNSIKNTDERVMILEKERSDLQTALQNLESKVSDSREDVSKLSTLKFEYEDLWGRVEDLQVSLDKATAQANQAFLELEKNQELRKKVSKLEESLDEANVYKVSSERLQQYNELMQQQISLLEDRLQKSDEDIHSFLQLYQESVREFQDALDTLKEESRKRSLDKPVDDMPREFWSRLLLMIDGWLLEKKLPADDASLLREMVWKRDGRIYNAYMECKDKNERETIATFLGLVSTTSTSPGLHVIHIAAEMAPVAKVGGLGDVVTGLSKALQKKGHLVEIVLPKYDCMEYDRIQDLRALDVLVESYFNGKVFKNKIWVGTVEGLAVYFIEPLHPDKFFWRGQLYGENDDFKRFSYFSRAALELLLQAGKKPDIIHCHDWQTAFVAPLYWDLYAPKGLNSARICFTCHNFEYQGTAHAAELAACGLDVQQLNRPDRMQDHSLHDRVNPVKGAVVFSNIVTTVSPTYAQEVRTAEGGKGLHTTLNLHSKKFVGILNGIDTDAWNPATDSLLEVQYTDNDLQGKEENKKALRRQLGLSNASPRQPLVGCITRLVPQKGVHLIRHAIYRTLELGGQFVLLGSSPVPHIQREFEGIANQFYHHDHVRLILKYDESLSHLIYAATDMFIVPSIFEPCGLTQMIAMRYGSVPIARKTGGLNDSVFDVDDDIIPLQFRNGFTFTNADEQGVNGALDRALSLFKNNPEKWEQLVLKVMGFDFSWDSSSSKYEELYSQSVARAKLIQRI